MASRSTKAARQPSPESIKEGWAAGQKAMFVHGEPLTAQSLASRTRKIDDAKRVRK